MGQRLQIIPAQAFRNAKQVNFKKAVGELNVLHLFLGDKGLINLKLSAHKEM